MFRPYTRPRRQTIPARRSSNRERTQSRRSRALGFRPARHVRIIHRPKTIGSQAAAVESKSGPCLAAAPGRVSRRGNTQPSASLSDLRRYASPRQQYYSAALPLPRVSSAVRIPIHFISYPRFLDQLPENYDVPIPCGCSFSLEGCRYVLQRVYPAISTHAPNE
ncbi:hypothetical protein BDP67DRAFT_119409 [Colletotrichum lupini]|nr:hypothetical protein BDP67DRAFT_119409 [Colletotrichum lupini]